VVIKIINKKFELDCIRISLTQQIDEKPVIISGPGTIHQDSDGILNQKWLSLFEQHFVVFKWNLCPC